MQVDINVTESEVKSLVLYHLRNKLGDGATLKIEDIKIEVKSKQNYKSEWEIANFRATYKGEI